MSYTRRESVEFVKAVESIKSHWLTEITNANVVDVVDSVGFQTLKLACTIRMPRYSPTHRNGVVIALRKPELADNKRDPNLESDRLISEEQSQLNIERISIS